MPARLLCMLVLLIGISGFSHAALPRYATELQKYSEFDKPSADAIRLRVSVATENASRPEKSVATGDILLCGARECYRARTAGLTAMHDTASGKASTLADVTIPRITITDVYFSDPGKSGLSGQIKLQAPLIIEKDFHGIEIFITVRKQVNGQRADYVPAQSTSMYFNTESELVHYSPAIATVAQLSRGVTLTIPSAALDRPHLFHVGVLDVGKAFASVDIFPYTALNKALTVDATALRAPVTSDEQIVPLAPALDAASAAASTAVPRLTSHITLPRTGVIEAAALERAAAAAPTRAVPEANAAKSCAEYLAQPVVFSLLNLTLLQTGAARIKACENIKPYVHMVYVNTADKRIRFSVPYRLSTTGKGHAPQLGLQRITEFTPSAIALINGFTWEGDYGLVAGGSGAAEGIVRSAGVALGDNVIGGGRMCSGCATDTLQFVMGFSTDLARPGFFSTRSPNAIGAYSFNTVSSTTSVVKSGSCQTPGSPGRWTAVGASNGRMLLVSSTSGGQTSAAELCTVFKALAINNALRLDGGPSAAMVVSGTVLNELTGIDRIKYGALRRIAYPLRVSH